MSDATSGDCELETDCYSCLRLEDFLGRGVCKFCIGNSTCTGAGGADDDPFYCMDGEWETDTDQCTQLTAAQQWTIIGICVGIALLVACLYIYYQRQLEKEKIADEETAKKQRAMDKLRREREQQEYKDIQARAAATEAQAEEEEEYYDRGQCSGEHEIYGEGGCQNEACEELELCDPMCPGCPDMKPLRPKPKRTHDPAPVPANSIDPVGPPSSPEVVEFTEINIQEHMPAHEDAPLPQLESPPAFNRAMTAKVLDNDGDTTSEDDSD